MIITRSAGGIRGVSGSGGGGPGNTWRQIAAPKQKALNSQRGEADPDPGGVGTLEDGAVGGQLGPTIGGILHRLRRHRTTASSLEI